MPTLLSNVIKSGLEGYSTSASITAGTNAQGQGPIVSEYNIITTTASNPSGVTLPVSTPGKRCIIVNRGSNLVKVYPATDGYIDGLAINTAIDLPVNGWMEFNASTTTRWYSSYNITAPIPDELNDLIDVVITTPSTNQVLAYNGTNWVNTSAPGDMLKATYDTNNDGIVDQAASVPWSGITGVPSTFTPSSHTHIIGDVTGLQTALDGKQASLVSGTNIKTINGTSVLGSGDLVISGEGGGDVTGPASSTANHLPTFADTTGKVIQEAIYFDIPAIDIPAAPAAGDLRWFARNRAGRVLPHIIGPSGIDVALQPGLFGNSIYMWLPGAGATTAINWGSSFTARNSGTGAAQAHPTKTSTNAMTSLNRATFGTGTTATGASGVQSSASVAWRGNAANLGGFFFFARFGIETFAADMRVFVGLSANNATMAADSSTWANTIGLCKDSADSAWQLLQRNATTATKTSTNLTVAAGPILDLLMFAPPNGSSVTMRLVNAVDGTVYVDNVALNTTLPVNTTFLFMQAHCQSVTGTTAKLLALNRIYVETDL